MAMSYADLMALLSSAQELRGTYGSGTSARVWRCARMLMRQGDTQAATVCLQLAKIIDTLAGD